MRNFKKLLSVVVLTIFSLAIFTGCAGKTVTMKDMEGTEFKVPKKIERIVSTAPSNTEILVGLGLGDKIVGVDKYSADIKGLKSDVTKIDFRNPDAEAIIALKPDVIIASGHNREGKEDPFKALKDAGIPVVYLPTAESINGIYDDINFLGKLTGTEEKGTEMVSNLKGEVDKIKAIGEKIKDKKTVYFEIGSGEKLYSFGSDTFLNELLTTIGAENIFKDQKGWISPSEESVIKKNPDVILTNEDYIKDATKQIEKRPGFNTINAVKNKEVFLVDKNATSRPSQNVISALKQIAKDIYPKEYANI
ncbi:MAG: ABC transporter substrate-binding protein [Clostridium chrysemydis]|uniref:ABC transporter substrate-binding protein n=1 Tax=Clostridium TaxID=1485 RepID=UPI0021534B65|nr:ABC transporter substrate-binding protein [Clostridium sp. LY3-2]MCR6514082.1 ABC transporter substrate-binding protein [Clostridium sp. LY3-2]